MDNPTQFIGCKVIVNSGYKDIYEGTVKQIDTKRQAIVLNEVFLNNTKLAASELSLAATDITDLKILKLKDEKARASSSICKNEDIDNFKKKKGFNSPREQRSSKGNDGGKKANLKQKHAERDKQCFGDQALSPTLPDFDFEKNLALFDKEGVFEKLKMDYSLPERKIEANEQKLKPNEHVLEREPVSLRQIKAPFEHVGKEYTTDNGLVVPSISLELRQQLIRAAEKSGLTRDQMNETAAICTCLMSLQLVGGNSRICLKNSHQNASVVILAGPHTQGLQAILTARHLLNHIVNVRLLAPQCDPKFRSSLDLFVKSGGQLLRSFKELPQQPLDLIIDATNGHNQLSYDWLPPIVRWANLNKAPVLGFDPISSNGLKEEIIIKWSISMALPLINSPSSGRLYVADIGIPRGVYQDVGISYHSPFMDKFYVALYG